MAVAAPTQTMNNVEAVRATLYEALKADPRTIVLGEDVGARGNVFLITKGFIEEFGPERIVDTPLAEASIVGVAIGMAIALGVTRFLGSLLYNVKAGDPLTFAGVALLLVAVAAIACYIPALRAARVDPMVALRYE